jgi:cellulose synthase/poly-beta-1,6-N-acetylglucosamine synthase-like glycosyltransferase
MTRPPLVSVVVPHRNDRDRIGDCLAALAAQDWPHDRLEVVVADGDSDDGSLETVRLWCTRDPRFRWVRNPRRATPFGLNEGIRTSRGEIVIVLGSHSAVAPQFVRQSVDALERSGADAAGGVIEAVGTGPVAEAVAAAVRSRFGVGSVAFRQAKDEGFVDTIAFAAYRRDVFERIGLFDEELVRDQDDELNYRLRACGGKLFLDPRIRTRYFVRSTLRGLWRQYFDYGLWKVRVLQKHPRAMKPRHFVPAASIAVGGALLLLGLWDRRALFAAGALAAAYGAGVVGISVAIARRFGASRLPASLAVFPTLHFSYGSGFLLGLVRFLPRWWRPEPPPPRL